jgi:hypothetical protein
MADPELSLQSILMVIAVIGRKKTFSYVGLVALFSVTAGLLYGSWVDGMSAVRLVVSMVVLVALLGALLFSLHRRQSSAVGS